MKRSYSVGGERAIVGLYDNGFRYHVDHYSHASLSATRRLFKAIIEDADAEGCSVSVDVYEHPFKGHRPPLFLFRSLGFEAGGGNRLIRRPKHLRQDTKRGRKKAVARLFAFARSHKEALAVLRSIQPEEYCGRPLDRGDAA